MANRDTWTVTGLNQDDGSLTVTGRTGQRTLPAAYVREHVELAYATTIHGAKARPSTTPTSSSARAPVRPPRTSR